MAIARDRYSLDATPLLPPRLRAAVARRRHRYSSTLPASRLGEVATSAGSLPGGPLGGPARPPRREEGDVDSRCGWPRPKSVPGLQERDESPALQAQQMLRSGTRIRARPTATGIY